MQKKYGFSDLVEIMAKLRSENGCPWDREQTHESIKGCLIEETYEVVEEINTSDTDGLCEELGDLMLQIVFHAQIEAEKGTFDINDVISGICRKLIHRHPHVFGNETANTADEVVDLWHRNKIKEKGLKSYSEQLDSVPRELPALMRSLKVQEKAARVGFDWKDASGPMCKVQEEFEELKRAYNEGNMEKITEEVGDLLFATVNVSRFLGVQPEFALTETIEKFIRRFKYIEDKCRISGKALEHMTLEEMDRLWDEAKTGKNIKK